MLATSSKMSTFFLICLLILWASIVTPFFESLFFLDLFEIVDSSWFMVKSLWGVLSTSMTSFYNSRLFFSLMFSLSLFQGLVCGLFPPFNKFSKVGSLLAGAFFVSRSIIFPLDFSICLLTYFFAGRGTVGGGTSLVFFNLSLFLVETLGNLGTKGGTNSTFFWLLVCTYEVPYLGFCGRLTLFLLPFFLPLFGFIVWSSNPPQNKKCSQVLPAFLNWS